MKILRHILSILLLPGMVTVVVPALILSSTGSINIGWSWSSPLNFAPSIIGLIFIGLGLFLMVQTIALFMTVGKGTIAPWDQTENLVVQGIYRYVRNPMISGVFCILLGEAILFGSLPLFYWFIFALLLNLVYIPLMEEPGMEQRFGESYRRYKQHVPRWIPRLHAWDGSA
jgi:protein-S-isoprenylcysteine O-methyltransferase Ste14